MTLVLQLPRPDATANVTNIGTAVDAANDPDSGMMLDNRKPQGPVQRTWQAAGGSTGKWIAAVIIIAIAALAMWYVLKKMK